MNYRIGKTRWRVFANTIPWFVAILPSVDLALWGNSHRSYTGWDVCFRFLIFEIGFGRLNL